MASTSHGLDGGNQQSTGRSQALRGRRRIDAPCCDDPVGSVAELDAKWKRLVRTPDACDEERSVDWCGDAREGNGPLATFACYDGGGNGGPVERRAVDDCLVVGEALRGEPDGYRDGAIGVAPGGVVCELEAVAACSRWCEEQRDRCALRGEAEASRLAGDHTGVHVRRRLTLEVVETLDGGGGRRWCAREVDQRGERRKRRERDEQDAREDRGGKEQLLAS